MVGGDGRLASQNSALGVGPPEYAHRPNPAALAPFLDKLRRSERLAPRCETCRPNGHGHSPSLSCSVSKSVPLSPASVRCQPDGPPLTLLRTLSTQPIKHKRQFRFSKSARQDGIGEKGDKGTDLHRPHGRVQDQTDDQPVQPDNLPKRHPHDTPLERQFWIDNAGGRRNARGNWGRGDARENENEDHDDEYSRLVHVGSYALA